MMTLLIHRTQEIVMKKLFKEALEDSPIIAAVKDDEGLSRCLTSDSRIIFILYGDIVTIGDIVETVKSAGKLAIVHLDLINGLSSKEVAVDFLQKYTNADGIITTKPVIAGGLVSEKEDILALLDAGATSISSTNEKIWFL